jgi:hypothetical protein
MSVGWRLFAEPAKIVRREAGRRGRVVDHLHLALVRGQPAPEVLDESEDISHRRASGQELDEVARELPQLDVFEPELPTGVAPGHADLREDREQDFLLSACPPAQMFFEVSQRERLGGAVPPVERPEKVVESRAQAALRRKQIFRVRRRHGG